MHQFKMKTANEKYDKKDTILAEESVALIFIKLNIKIWKHTETTLIRSMNKVWYTVCKTKYLTVRSVLIMAMTMKVALYKMWHTVVQSQVWIWLLTLYYGWNSKQSIGKRVVYIQKREWLPLFMPPIGRGLLTNPILALPSLHSAVPEVVRPIEIGTLIYWLELLDFTNVFFSVSLDVGSKLISTDLN